MLSDILISRKLVVGGEDKLISMFISLESLFLGKEERGELRYRLSLRAATLIGNMSGRKRSELFDDLKRLYDKRSAVVHGGAEKVTYDDISALETYVRYAVKGFVSLLLQTQTKKDILDLLDHV